MIRSIAAIVIASVVVMITGCVPITYTKSVTVHKDANGKILSIEEHESITEPHSEMKKIKPIDDTTFQSLK